MHPQYIARSSNGRTSDFGSDCVGSNPARATKEEPSAYAGGFAFYGIQTCLMIAEKAQPTSREA